VAASVEVAASAVSVAAAAVAADSAVAEAAASVEEARPVAGRRFRRVEDAVQAAEASTGLQFCVYLGRTEDNARSHAESMFVDAGLHERPAVLLLVAPRQRKVEIVTSPSVGQRLPDNVCAEAITVMTERFRKRSYSPGLVAGLQFLAHAAGPGVSAGPDLPDIVDDLD
jgi:uncharacterized membrane protein